MITSSGYHGIGAIAPQAFAETSPQFYSSYFVPRTGIQLATSFATYGALYQAQPWVFTVVDKIANLISRLGVQVWDTTPTTGNVLDTAGPYARLMADPCDTLDPFAFWHWLATTIEVYGEAFLLKIRNDVGQVTSFVPMHPAMTSIHRDQDGYTMYRFMGKPNELFQEEDVVPFRRYNPLNTMRGMSRLEPLRTTLMNEDSARRAQTSFFNSMGRPSMVLSTPKKLGIEGRAALKAGFDATQAGADNAGGLMILEDDVTANKMQLDSEEMQYIESRKLNREEVCAVYDIAPPAVQILDHATFSNIDVQFRDIYKNSVAFRLRFIESTINFHVGANFNGAKVMQFNVAEQLRGDIEVRVPAAVQLVQSGIAKPSEMRPWFDLDDAGPVADRLYANQAMQPLGEKPATPAPAHLPSERQSTVALPPVTGSLPEKVTPAGEKQLIDKYVRDIGSWIGRGKSWREATLKLMRDNPAHYAEIKAACEHVVERNR